MPRASNAKAVEDLTYEEALAELEKAVDLLEAGKIPLDESMRLFERGQALLSRCSSLLQAAELKVQKLDAGELLPFEEGVS